LKHNIFRLFFVFYRCNHENKTGQHFIILEKKE
jgi:hypothetical protein